MNNFAIKMRINCKLHPWSLGLIGFYTPKFQKLDFTPWSLVPLVIHPPQLVSVVKWHIIMLMYFIFAKSATKLRHFSDDQMKSWHTSKLRRFINKLKTKISSLNDRLNSKIWKQRTRRTNTSLAQTPRTQSSLNQTPRLRLNSDRPSAHIVNPGSGSEPVTAAATPIVSCSSLSLFEFGLCNLNSYFPTLNRGITPIQQ